ncbi:hypothetical protein B0E50_17155 [Rhodanobacter sp. C01]|nr:hypothetical protein B0E50_17155 [Rhodanobacter sp. C01]
MIAGFKREAVRLMQTSGKPAAMVAGGPGISLTQELTHHACFKTRDEIQSKVFDYIGVFQNRQHLYSSPGTCSQVAFERLNCVA